jgi:hypothetical protein
MASEPDVAAIGAALADPGRAAMLMALLGGESLRAGRSLRNRFFTLASADVADALEAIARIALVAPVRSLRESRATDALRNGRTCYDHLAGRLGVAVTDRLVERGLLARQPGAFALARRPSGPPQMDVHGRNGSRRIVHAWVND